nr:unnamed protein product [Callosobruchus analis]
MRLMGRSLKASTYHFITQRKMYVVSVLHLGRVTMKKSKTARRIHLSH